MQGSIPRDKPQQKFKREINSENVRWEKEEVDNAHIYLEWLTTKVFRSLLNRYTRIQCQKYIFITSTQQLCIPQI